MKPVTRRLLITMSLGFVLLLMLRAYSPFVGINTDESLIQKPWLALHSGVSVVHGGRARRRQMVLAHVSEVQMMYALLWLAFPRRLALAGMLVFPRATTWPSEFCWWGFR